MGTNTIATKRCITTAVSEVLRDMEALAKNPRDTVLGILQEAAKADLPLPTVSHDPFRGGARQRPGSRLPPGVAEAAAHYARMARKWTAAAHQRTILSVKR